MSISMRMAASAAIAGDSRLKLGEVRPMIKSDSISALAAALCKAQAMMKPAPKDRENPFFHSTYSTLASVLDALREPLNKNGLTIVFLPESDPVAGVVTVTTMLLHTSGEYLGSPLSAKPVKSDPQAYGSCVSYLKRYGAQAVTAQASEDDDGNSASAPQPAAAPPTEAIYRKADKAQKLALDTFLKKNKVDQQFWASISDAMDGRNKGDIDEVMAGIV